MRTLMAVLTFCCFFSLVGWAVAGPFGTEMGQKPEQFTSLKEIEVPGPNAEIYSFYETDTLPKMNTFFDRYKLLFGKNGLARVTAFSKIYKDDGYGYQVQEIFYLLKKQLTKKYGKPKSYDFLEKGSKWNKDKDFIMAINSGERDLAAVWKTDLPNNIASIVLEVKAQSPTSSYLSLVYKYKNYRAIMQEIEKTAEDAL